MLKRAKRFAAGALAASLVGALGFASGATAAQADTVYEIKGEWQSDTPLPPETVKTGDNVGSVWKFNINDDGPAPSNDPVDNVTVTFTAHGGEFTEIPDACLTEGVNPVSAIQDKGSKLVCNLGTRDQGTAELMLTGLRVVGESGASTWVEAEIGGETAELPPLNIANPFAMDMKFDGGARSNPGEGTEQFVRFPWSLRHGPGGEPGPDSVEYTLTFNNTAGKNFRVVSLTDACVPIDRAFANHPFSDDAHAPQKTAPFPGTCTFKREEPNSNKFILTISGIDYSKTQLPSQDSTTGQVPLEEGWDVVAAGMLQLRLDYEQPGQVSFTSSEPTYKGSVTGAEAKGLTENNKNNVQVTRGIRTGGWVTGQVGLPGTIWADTSRAAPEDLVRQVVGIRPPVEPGTTNAACSILDTKYVTFEGVKTGHRGAGSGVPPYPVDPYPNSGGIRHWYYVGNGPNNVLNPNHANYNPNKFDCGTGWATKAGWTDTPPEDLSTVKAVRVQIPYNAAAGINATDDAGLARTFVESRVKPGVAAGQDIWAWSGFYHASDPDVPEKNRNKWIYPYNSNPDKEKVGLTGKPDYGVATPGMRYGWTSISQDILRVVTAKPVIEKTADQEVTKPGATVQYELKYKAAALSTFDVNDGVIVDVLPEGTEYVPGSASIEPTSVNGRTLTWKIPTLTTNEEQVLYYSVLVSDDAEPGQTFTNNASFSIEGQTVKASDTVRILDGGYVELKKTAEADKVTHASGVAENTWSVRLTSHDTKQTAFTDTIDILPFNGDGRGTEFSGSYKLKEPVQAVSGAKVYYTTADPETLVDDPADSSNGAAGNVAGNSVGWTTTFMEDATAVRVIGPALKPSEQQEFTISVVTEGAKPEDRHVNRAESRSERHELKMRTSSEFTIAPSSSISIKKYVKDVEGEWHDANESDDYPTRYAGDTVPYKLVVTNTGETTLKNVVIEDDKVDLAKLDPLPAGLTLLDGKAVIEELLPGEDNAVTIEYTIELGDEAEAGTLVNVACAIPENEEVDEDCDPAGIIVENSSLSWEKVSAGDKSKRLAGSEWSLQRVDKDGEPIGDAVKVTDCIEDAADKCSGPDVNPEAGKFKLSGLAAGDYVLTETRAPAGYVLDDTPRKITVSGDTAFEAPIENKQSDVPQLPLTGGMGTFAIFSGAGVAGLLAAYAVWMQRRRSREALS